MSKKNWVVTVFSCCFVAATVAAFGGFVWAADEPRVATIEFGNVSLELGMDKDEVIAALEPGFAVTEMGPIDPVLFPDCESYYLNDRERLRVEPLRSYAGTIAFRGGTLRQVAPDVMDGKSTLDSEELMTRLTDLLGVVSERTGTTTPSVQWDDGVFQGRKTDSRKLSFDFGLERVTVQYADSPGASQRVILRWGIGKP